jgi:hypothetical protein
MRVFGGQQAVAGLGRCWGCEMRHLFLLALPLLVLTSTMTAAQMMTAKPSRNQLYVGAPFMIDLTITPPEAVADLDVEAAGPPGFQIAPPKKSMPSRLGAGSSYTAVYEITAPPSAHATTENYRIVFNVRYRHANASSGEPQMWQSVEVPFTVTLSRWKFYFWAIAGLFVGWLIKALGSLSGVLPFSTAKPVEVRRGVRILLSFLSRREITSALTSLAVGFLALLLLSRHELPTGAIHDSLALGIGLGFLSDDQLLNRIKVVGSPL